VYLPSYAPVIVRSEAEIERAVEGIDLTRRSLFYYSYHPQGTCRMGPDPTRYVVAPTGETHDVKALYIADASLFPTSILVNPQLTVYALSSVIADHLNALAW
jgi:choline dehydrogenase-like flavoprotein